MRLIRYYRGLAVKIIKLQKVSKSSYRCPITLYHDQQAILNIISGHQKITADDSDFQSLVLL